MHFIPVLIQPLMLHPLEKLGKFGLQISFMQIVGRLKGLELSFYSFLVQFLVFAHDSLLSVFFRIVLTYEPRCEKTGLWGFRPGTTQTRLYSHRICLDA